MSQDLMKSMALRAISRGMRLPQAKLDRLSELYFLRKLLIQLKIDCVLDVGANRGQFAQELRRIGYGGFIVSFEPVSSEFSVMEKHFENDPKWKGYQLALGSDEKQMLITVPKLTVMSSLLKPTTSERGAREELIQVRRLDAMLPSLVENASSPHVFLKMDTQGYDLEVFKGTSGCLDMIHGIESELSVQPLYQGMPHYLEALEVYEAARFDLYNLSVVNRVSNGGLLELNCFMRRAG